VVVNPSISATTLPEFIAYGKTNPGKINMASPGNGTLPHLAGELFKMMTGVNITFVTYRGDAPAITDLLGGQVQMMIPAPAASIEYIRAGKLRALAVTTPTRWEGLPDAALGAAEAAVVAMRKVRGVILPFPGGMVRAGSKVGAKNYKKLPASTPPASNCTTTDRKAQASSSRES